MIELATWDDSRLELYRLLAAPARLKAAGLFVAEGRLVVRRLLASPRFRTRSVLVTPAAAGSLADILPSAGVPVLVIPQALMNDVAGFNIHRGCLALAERPPAVLLDALTLDTATRLLVLEGVNNPDNVGGLFRSAAAFGVDAVVLGPSCGDPLYRKAVRTSMGAVLTVPFADAGPWPAALAWLSGRGFGLVALTPAAEALPLQEVSWPERVALLAGAEGPGLTPAALAATGVHARIPTTDRVDSLNVTTAVSIALYALSSSSPAA